MTALSEFTPIYREASREYCDALIKDILERDRKENSYHARSYLEEGDFFIHEGDLWIDDDLVIDRWVIVTGDLIVNGICHDGSETMLIVLGNMRCAHLFSDAGISVFGDLICGGLSYQYYNDWSLEVGGTLSARALTIYDKGVGAKIWRVDEKGEINCDAEAACRLLGFRDGRPYNKEDSTIGMDEALRRIEDARREKETFLDLENIELTELPEELFELAWLEELDLGGNQLRSIPEGIGRLSKLEGLYVNDNDLRRLPESIGRLGRLESLILSDNQLKSLPETIGLLSSLKVLDVFYNRLTDIPETIGQLTHLEDLDLRENGLTCIPKSIAQLSLLQALRLNNNPVAERLSRQEVESLSENPLSDLPHVLERITAPDRTERPQSEGTLSYGLNDEAADDLPVFPDFNDCRIMLLKLRQQGKNAFVAPFPPMAELIERWGENWAWRKRLWYPDRADVGLCAEERKQLTEKGASWLFELIISKHLPPEEFERYLRHEDIRVRWALAVSSASPLNCLRILAKDSEAVVRAGVAGNLNCPRDLRAELEEDAEPHVRISTLYGMHPNPYHHPDISVLARLATDADVAVRQVVAAIPDLPPALVQRLTDDPDGNVRARAMYYQIEDVSVFVQRAGDSDPEIRYIAALRAKREEPPFDKPEHQETCGSILQKLMFDPDDKVRKTAANGWQPFTFYEANAGTMAEDSLPSVRRILAGITRNPDILSQLADDKDKCVLEEVIDNPNTPSRVLDDLCRKNIDSIQTIIAKQQREIFSPTGVELAENVGNKQFTEKLTKVSELQVQLNDRILLAQKLADNTRLSTYCIGLLLKIEKTLGYKIFEKQPNLTPLQLVERGLFEIEDDCDCECCAESRDIARRLDQYAREGLPYNRFFDLLIDSQEYKYRQIAYTNTNCPPETLLRTVKRYIDDDGEGESESYIENIAANPALPDEARALLAGRLKQAHSYKVMSSLDIQPRGFC